MLHEIVQVKVSIRGVNKIIDHTHLKYSKHKLTPEWNHRPSTLAEGDIV